MRPLIAFIAAMLSLLGYPRSQAEGSKHGQSQPDNQEEGRRTGSIIAELQIPQAVMDRYDAKQRAQQEREQQIDRTDKYRLWVEAFTLGFVVIATVGAFLSLQASNRSAKVATDTFMVANDSMVIENRAWLYFDRSNYRALENVDIRQTLTIRNRGKTPAFNIDGCVVFELLPVTEGPFFDYTPKSGRPCYRIKISVLPPDGSSPDNLVALERGPGPKPLVPDRNTMLAYQSGSKYVISHARFTFRDVFGIDHWVQICDYIFEGVLRDPPIPAFLACVQYHQMDNYTRKGQSEDQP